MVEFGKDVGGEFAVVGSDFDDSPWVWLVIFVPPVEEAAGEDFPEEWADADAGVKVSAAPYLAVGAGVVAVLRVVEGGGHVVGEGDGAIFGDFPVDDGRQGRGCGRF